MSELFDNKNIKAILFDLDDTINDRKRSIRNFCSSFIKDYFPQAIDKEAHDTIMLHLISLDANGMLNREKFFTKISMVYNLNIDCNDLAARWGDIFPLFSYLKEDAIIVLDYLQGKYKLGIISNGTSTSQRNKIRSLEIEHYFRTIVISEEIGYKKPEEEIFRITCNTISESVDSVVYVGNDLFVDVIGARNAGLIPIWLSHKRKKGVITINGLVELMNLF